MSTPAKGPSGDGGSGAKKNCKTRHFVTFMLFLGMANAYVMRTNMSVTIVAMINHTAIGARPGQDIVDEECESLPSNQTQTSTADGDFSWSFSLQGYILSSFFYGYVIMQIPFGFMAMKYGAIRFLGWGMMLNSVVALLVPISAYKGGALGLCAARFVQGLGEGPIVPCTHTLLAKWIPPNERSRVGAAIYSGAQFGTIIAMSVSGLLATYDWAMVFYVFGVLSILWSALFLWWMYEDPTVHPKISEDERDYILRTLNMSNEVKPRPPIPFRYIARSMPFYAILLAHLGYNYGYETLMTELPTYMNQVLRFSLKENGFYSSLPYLSMWMSSLVISQIADWMITAEHCSITTTRKIINSLGEYGPGLALIAISYTGCHRVMTVVILTIGMGLCGSIFSGFKVNHLDLSSNFAGGLISVTNCTANLIGLLGPIVAGHLIDKEPTIAQWRIVFLISASVFIFCATFYNIFASGKRQWWDDPANVLAKKQGAAT